MSDSLRPHELQHTRLFCPSLSPGVFSDSCPLCQWCHPTISSSVTPFSSFPQSFPASGSVPISPLFFNQVAKILELWLQHQSFQWMFRVAFSRVFSSITIFLYVSVQWEAWRWAAHLGICTTCFCSHVYFLTVTQWPLQLQHFVCVPRRTKGKGPNACTCYVWTLSCEPYSVLSTRQPALCHMALRAGKWSVLTRHGLW